VCSVALRRTTYDVADEEDKMLVGRNGGFDILDRVTSYRAAQSSEVLDPVGKTEKLAESRIVRHFQRLLDVSQQRVLKTVKTAGSSSILSLQSHDNHIYTLCAEDSVRASRKVIIFDGEGREMKTWSVPDYEYVSSLTVSNNKVYVSDPDSKRVCVYSMLGTQIGYISNASFHTPLHLNICPPHSLLISDCKANRVHRLDCRSDTITWTSAVVKKPRGIAVDHTGIEVWVWSDTIKAIVILDSDTGNNLHYERLYRIYMSNEK